MDNPLTPNKIQRLIRLAEDKSLNMTRHFLLDDEDLKRLATHKAATVAKSPGRYESSSGILDLENIEAFGESAVGSMSLSKSSIFNPGEMTGRSTGTEESNTKLTAPPNEMCGRHSLAIEAITNEMNKQTNEVHDIMRHSIATNYSFHSKPNLTADEQSLVMREAPLPIMQTTVPHIQDNLSDINSSSLSTYFMKRCLDFKNILGKVDSPDKQHYRPSISEVSYSTHMETPQKESKHDIDQSLDCVPVRQPRVPIATVPEMTKSLRVEPADVESAVRHDITLSKDEKGKYVPNSSSCIDYRQKPGPVQSVQNFEDYIKKINQSSLQLMSDETESSLSLSRIADYLGKHSNLNVSDILNMHHHKSESKRMQPMKELQMNMQESRNVNNETQVTYLKHTKKGETASSTSTMSTVLSMDRLKLNKENIASIPELVVTHCTVGKKSDANSLKTEGRTTRSRSPSSKSHSTLNTVQENHLSFKSFDSPLHSSRGEHNASRPLSPHVEYKELDKSVDWQEVLRQRTARNKSLAKEHWAEITTSPVTGFVGTRTAVTIIITTFTDSWLTGQFRFDSLPHDGHDVTVELPRLPILLSPGKSEHFILHITSNVEIEATLPFTLSLKDASIDCDTEQKGDLDVKITLPTVQAMSSDGVNKLSFAPVLEKSTTTKSLVLVSDCPEDLQLYLSIAEGDSIFAIKNVHEIKKSDVNKVLMHRQCSAEEAQTGKAKSKTLHKQLCRLTAGNAIRVSITFNAPKLTELQIPDDVVTLKGAFNVNLFGIDTVLKKIDLVGIVGTVDLVFKSPSSRLHISNDTTTVDVVNQGSAPAAWVVKIECDAQREGAAPFAVSPASSELPPGGARTLSLRYAGPPDAVVEGTLLVEETTTGKTTSLAIYGGCERPKSFPIKTNHISMSWVRAGRKELSLKNTSQKKVHIRCHILGEGFAIDAPGVDSRGSYSLSFGACECRPLPITFAPSSGAPLTATLHLVVDNTDSEFSRKIMLFGCSGGAALRWSGLATYGGTALARAVAGAPVELALHNRAPVPAFAAATVRFNLQYSCVSARASLSGARRVVRARGSHAVALRVPWERVRRRAAPAPAAAAALATLTVITGAEITRRRILKILRDESNGELNASLLPDHLKILTDKFEGEDPAMDNCLANFKETKTSLNELIEGIQELTAQIDLPQDFLDETTVVIGDETVLEHHTICD